MRYMKKKTIVEIRSFFQQTFSLRKPWLSNRTDFNWRWLTPLNLINKLFLRVTLFYQNWLLITVTLSVYLALELKTTQYLVDLSHAKVFQLYYHHRWKQPAKDNQTTKGLAETYLPDYFWNLGEKPGTQSLRYCVRSVSRPSNGK